jgi:ribosome-binding factor A
MHVPQQKLAAQIQRAMSILIAREVTDPRVDGMISITKVELTPDQREAKIYVSLMGNKNTPSTVVAGLQAAAMRLRKALGKNVQQRTLPQLRFVLDETLKRQAIVLQKIAEATANPAPAPTPDDQTN